MKTIKTTIKINATPQTVWSVMDDLQRYPEWNHLTPDLAGRTTVGSIVRGTLTKQGAPQVPIGPTINAIVGAREFRWLTNVPGFRAEHYFLLQPTSEGGTELTHCEDFDGEAIAQRWAGIEATSPPAFNGMNRDLKARAELLKATAVNLHPAVDKGTALVRAAVIGTTLRCLCTSNQAEIRITRRIHHNHLCGCSKCWKPAGALFAQTAVVTSDGFELSANGQKLAIVDARQSIQRHACRDCGAHLYGDVPDVNHHFHGLCFVHPELARDSVCGAPEFAGFVSSLIESGTCPSLMEAIRGRLAALKIPAFDGFSPEIMDIIAWHKRKLTLYPQATS
jgi:S-(hydroxymethyl)glutathione synthase